MEKVTKLDTEKRLTRIGNYKLTGKTLGKGHFAHVKEGYHTLLKVKVAIKIINKEEITDVYVKKNLKRESKIMSKIFHPNIVYLFETIETKKHYYIVTELCSGEDLCNFVKSQLNGKLNEGQARFFAKQLVLAVGHLHSNGVVHRDLKMENVILDVTKTQIKLVDFGLSNFRKHSSDLFKTHCGSPEYAAPELYVSGIKYGPEIDIWSLGIIFYGMLVGKLPFQTWHKIGLDQNEKRKYLMMKTRNGLTLKQHKNLMELSHLAESCIAKMLNPDPNERISMHELQNHIWLSSELSNMKEYPILDRKWERKVISKISDYLKLSYTDVYEKIIEIPYGQNSIVGIFNIKKYLHLNAKMNAIHLKHVHIKNLKTSRENSIKSTTSTKILKPPLTHTSIKITTTKNTSKIKNKTTRPPTLLNYDPAATVKQINKLHNKNETNKIMVKKNSDGSQKILPSKKNTTMSTYKSSSIKMMDYLNEKFSQTFGIYSSNNRKKIKQNFNNSFTEHNKKGKSSVKDSIKNKNLMKRDINKNNENCKNLKMKKIAEVSNNNVNIMNYLFSFGNKSKCKK